MTKNTTPAKAPRDKAMITIQCVIWVFMITAAVISFSHIVKAGHMLGLDSEAYLAPLFIDGLAIVGKVSMMDRFKKPFRDSGKKLLMLGGALSLAANVGAGDNWGKRAFGVLVVAGFMYLENHLTKAGQDAVAEPVQAAKPAPKRLTQAEKDARNAARARNKEAARLAAMTPAQRGAEKRKANKAARLSLAPAAA